MTITLTPQTEELLREKAEHDGQDVSELADSLIISALEWEAWDRAETIAGIQRGLDDFAAGRYRPFSEFAAEKRAKYNLPSRGKVTVEGN